jgi:hypothetical protein
LAHNRSLAIDYGGIRPYTIRVSKKEIATSMTEKISGEIPPGRIGPFEILSLLGRGGMGVVYKARDTRLGRDVAIKLIAGDFAGQLQLARRFEQEARAVSALSHPNIMALYDMGLHAGQPYLVCELLQGQSLKERLASGPLPPAQAARVTAEVARGLAAAHAKGIIHRDLKPGNIFLTRERAKILDFGLAKASASEPVPASASQTEPGMIMGTVAYLSPEQVRGQAADARSDLFSLGIVLYEMLTGTLPFTGESSAETMVAILREEPREPVIPDSGFSAGLLRILKHCLEKDPELRFQNASDLAFNLENLVQPSGTSAAHAGAEPRRKRMVWLPLLAGAVLALVLGGCLALALLGPKEKPLPLFERISFVGSPIVAARFLPDGQGFAYSTVSEQGTCQLWVSREAGPKLIELPDARLLAVSAAGELAVLTAVEDNPENWGESGKLVRAFPDGTRKDVLDNVLSADWMRNGKDLCAITVGMDAGQKEYRVEWPLGNVRFRSRTWLWDLRLSPDGKRLCFCMMDENSMRELQVIDGKGTRVVIKGLAELYSPQWTPESDRIIYFGGSSWIANTVYCTDLRGSKKLMLSTPQPPIVWDVNSKGELLLIQGRDRYVTKQGRREEAERDLAWMDQSVVYGIAPAGERLLLLDRDLEPGARGDAAYLRASDGSPALKIAGRAPYCLSEDGGMSAVESVENSYFTIQLIPTGAGHARTLTTPVRLHSALAFYPDGQSLLLRGALKDEQMRLFRQPIDGGPPRPITPQGVRAVGVLSADGAQVIAAVNDGIPRVYSGPGDKGREIPGLQPGDRICQWDQDNQHIYIIPKGKLPLDVLRLDIGSGRRQFWLRLRADGGPGTELVTFHITRDGMAYAYSYLVTVMSDLYRVTNWR